MGYEKLPGLEEVYLEDSYVLGIDQREGMLTFLVEVVLRPAHPRYERPGTGEQYCYRTGRLVFSNAAAVHWNHVRVRPSQDATGSCDIGNIDTFRRTGRRSHLTGDWGDVEFESDPPELQLDN